MIVLRFTDIYPLGTEASQQMYPKQVLQVCSDPILSALGGAGGRVQPQGAWAYVVISVCATV